MPSRKISRHAYHHGDLANALTGAAYELACAGGPDAVVLREAARRIGVSATAVYRHFASRDDLLHVVKKRALTELIVRIEEELQRVPADLDETGRLHHCLHALGAGYIGFALDKPGLFRTAFAHAEPTGRRGIDPMEPAPFRMLVATLDALVESGAVDADRRPFLELAAWATVHGVVQLLHGPMRHFSPQLRQAAVSRALDLVNDGIVAAQTDSAVPKSPSG